MPQTEREVCPDCNSAFYFTRCRTCQGRVIVCGCNGLKVVNGKGADPNCFHQVKYHGKLRLVGEKVIQKL